MRLSARSIVVSAAVLSLIALSAILYVANRSLSGDVSALTEQNGILEGSIEKIAAQKKDAEDKLVMLRAENARADEKISSYALTVEKLTSEYKINMDDLAAERDGLKANLTRLEKEISARDARIAGLNKELDLLNARMKAAGPQGAVSLDPIMISGAKEVTGRIIEVNKEYGFVVADVGSESGVSEGDVMFVSRRDSLLGKIVVEDVAPKHCAAKILLKSLADTVRSGDTVTR